MNAWTLLAELDESLVGIVWLSFRVSLSAVLIATLLGMPLGAWIAIHQFAGKRLLVITLNSLMSIPSVVVGVLVYLLLSRAGPLGSLGILFTPKAMVIAQVCLTMPLVAALTRQTIEESMREHDEALRSLRLPTLARVRWLLWDARFALLIVVLVGMGRAVSEIGSVMIVGGNIAGVTRTMTTSIALETSKGNLELSIALGVVLLAVMFLLNAFVALLRDYCAKRYQSDE